MNNPVEQPTSPEPTTPPAADPLASPAQTLLNSEPVDPAAPQEGESASAPEGEPPLAPLTADDIELPEGVTADPETLEGFVAALNADATPQERAASLLELHNGILAKAAEQSQEAWQTVQEQWRKDALALPDIGGENLPQTLGEVAKVLNTYGDQAAREAFDLTGAGNHPAVIKMFAAIAKDLNEAPPVPGVPPAGGPKTRAERMFGQ